MTYASGYIELIAKCDGIVRESRTSGSAELDQAFDFVFF